MQNLLDPRQLVKFLLVVVTNNKEKEFKKEEEFIVHGFSGFFFCWLDPML